jgi:hypothetical protein
MDPSWALEPKNRNVLTQTLRQTLELATEDRLTVTSISAARRLSGSSSSSSRNLQEAGGVKVEFTVTIAREAADRVSKSTKLLQKLSEGDVAVAAVFVRTLDSSLEQVGQPPTGLKAADVSFATPVTKVVVVVAEPTAPVSPASATGVWSTEVALPKAGNRDRDAGIVGTVLLVFAVGLVAVIWVRSNHKVKEEPNDDSPVRTKYQAKVDFGFSDIQAEENERRWM